ncbi:MAG: TIGR00725 family protein [Actinomycetota bacterium]|nr:TIGR00725 family protein [Actinomycetota bacterium]
MPTVGVYIGVVGSGDPSPKEAALAEEVGSAIASAGALLLCGGLGGVMEAACRGAKSAGGTTVAILPGASRGDANPYVDVAIATGMGEMRNALLVRACDALVAVAGEFGTLSEMAFALKTGVPVVGMATWELSREGRVADAIERVDSAREAVETAMRKARNTTARRDAPDPLIDR